MPRTCVTFRGEEHEVEYEAEVDDSVGHSSLNWWFTNMSPEQHAKLFITLEEDEFIAGECWAHYDDLGNGDWDD